MVVKVITTLGKWSSIRLPHYTLKLYPQHSLLITVPPSVCHLLLCLPPPRNITSSLHHHHHIIHTTNNPPILGLSHRVLQPLPPRPPTLTSNPLDPRPLLRGMQLFRSDRAKVEGHRCPLVQGLGHVTPPHSLQIRPPALYCVHVVKHMVVLYIV